MATSSLPTTCSAISTRTSLRCTLSCDQLLRYAVINNLYTAHNISYIVLVLYIVHYIHMHVCV